MTTKKFLSNKKEPLSISVSIALNEWIDRYLSKNRNKYPKDLRYKNKSVFCSFLLEKCMEILTSGKSLEDIRIIPDKEITDIYDNISFKAVIPFFDIGIIMNKYSILNINKIPSILLKFRNWVINEVDPNDFNSIKIIIERLKRYLLSNKLTKEIRIDLFKEKNSKFFKGFLEYIGIYKNLHFENCKGMVGILSILGLKVEDFMFSETDLYARFDFKETFLFRSSDIAKKERMRLLDHNLKHLVNFSKIINDKDHYLWIKMSQDNEIFLNFNSQNSLNNWINYILNDFRQYSTIDKYPLNFLKFLEKLHWISLENEIDLAFHIKITKKDDNEEEQFIRNELLELLKRNYSNNGRLKELVLHFMEKKDKEEEFVLNIIKRFFKVINKGDLYFLEK